ncbi:hypothetical protein FACS1894201_07220 [Bacteroidia bacterium]|nr:hypothetical protein FACS1894201_07220 [Bacteroidia bacterium]
MEYNTMRSPICIREYGRLVQQMITEAIKEPEREKRNQMANDIITAMAQLSTQQGNAEEWRQKLYDHLFIISDFKLDIDTPFPKPSSAVLQERPQTVPYSNNRIDMKCYGNSLQSMIVKAADYPEGEEKKALIRLLLIQMKRSYLAWNQSVLNSDALIAEHLKTLSHGKIVYSMDMHVDFDPELPNLNDNAKKKKHKKIKKQHNRVK